MIRSLVLFAHVVSVLALFVGLGLEWLSLDALRRSTARVEALRWLRVSTVVPRFSGIALATTTPITTPTGESTPTRIASRTRTLP